ncbi:DUF1127 domain-containing protein [Devosia sp. FJ2-5-3]|jgi:uncharacterized protein YjiS (DUF1127 family)|nr:DUF1127 domain-containing protein [Devosia sp. FJ2-5-3]WEJ58429.1 DUF1127 domain-containing protein [Devosia sp. FJ2-5-3]
MFKPIIHRIRNWHQRQDAIRRLRWLDDHLLYDIGTSKDDLPRFIRDKV